MAIQPHFVILGWGLFSYKPPLRGCLSPPPARWIGYSLRISDPEFHGLVDKSNLYLCFHYIFQSKDLSGSFWAFRLEGGGKGERHEMGSWEEKIKPWEGKTGPIYGEWYEIERLKNWRKKEVYYNGKWEERITHWKTLLPRISSVFDFTQRSMRKAKEFSLCHKIWFLNPYIFAILLGQII